MTFWIGFGDPAVVNLIIFKEANDSVSLSEQNTNCELFYGDTQNIGFEYFYSTTQNREGDK